MTPETTSFQINNIGSNGMEVLTPIRRCVSLGDAQVSADIDEHAGFNKLNRPKRNRKRARPVMKDELPSGFPSCIISTGAHEDDVIHSDIRNQESNFPRVVSSFPFPKDPDECMDMTDTDTSIKYSASSPVRSIVSCDADMIDDSIEDDSTPSSQEASPTTPSPLLEKELLCREVSNHPSSTNMGKHKSQNVILRLHLQATEAESLLLPLKPILSRLMSHPTYNRKGTFNTPVDYIGLGLNDYRTIIKNPMDLGTIKGRLQANLYLNHTDAARDVRLVFNNAQIYNPPSHQIHNAAKKLLCLFEEGYSAINYENKPPPTCDKSPNASLSQTQPVCMEKSGSMLTGHTCQACLGRACPICKTGCAPLEPTLLICTGLGCAGSKIRRGSNYYCSMDGSNVWCLKCYSCLPAVLPVDDSDIPLKTVSYKRDLLKRRNDEDVVERWITCGSCNVGMHEICAFSNEFTVEKKSFSCPLCLKSKNPFYDFSGKFSTHSQPIQKFVYSFVSGNKMPQKIENVVEGTAFDAGSLPSCSIAIFILEKIQERMLHLNCPPNAEKTLTIRVISESEKFFQVPEAIRRHFRLSSSSAQGGDSSVQGTEQFLSPPAIVNYQSKAIALFQRIDGMDVCIFCMYVQEYDNEDIGEDSDQSKRVYIAYLDSVEHLQPRRLRTQIYHEILVSYLATARVRGYEYAHIWSCPPSRGNSFVFWSHPATQRTPNAEHLLSWYHNALSYAASQGIVTEIQSLFEFSFQKYEKVDFGKDPLERSKKGRCTLDESIMVVPPLLEGDFWMEEAVRIHSASVTRFMKSKKPAFTDHGSDSSQGLVEVLTGIPSSCPVIHVATILHDCIMTHPSALAFCRPVNATALKLHDYHDIIKTPMDLGTIHSRCLLGEYDTLNEFKTDIELVFRNAMKYNPKGHIVHKMAEDMLVFTHDQFKTLASFWKVLGVGVCEESGHQPLSCRECGNISMRLGASIVAKEKNGKESSKFTALPPRNIDMSSKLDVGKGLPNTLAAPTIPQSVAEYKCNEVNDTQAKGPNLVTGGTKAIVRTMVGTDLWLLNKKSSCHSTQGKKKKKNQKKLSMKDNFPPPTSCQRRTESWLGDEVSAAVRRLRTDFFVCHLFPKKDMTNTERDQAASFSTYVQTFRDLLSASKVDHIREINKKSAVADTRNGLLEFSQYRNFQFDTIRRAKYSTAMLIYYLQNPHAPGLIPTCTKCQTNITDVRWHRVNKAFDERRRNSVSPSVRATCVPMDREDLCAGCFSETNRKDDFIPVRVSY